MADGPALADAVGRVTERFILDPVEVPEVTLASMLLIALDMPGSLMDMDGDMLPVLVLLIIDAAVSVAVDESSAVADSRALLVMTEPASWPYTMTGKRMSRIGERICIFAIVSRR